MLKITLDPGHYKNYNIGCIPGYYEGNKVFTLANMLKEELEKYNGVEVVMTKSSVEENPDLEARGEMAVNNGSQVFMSLHTDAGEAAAHGVTVIRSLHFPDSNDLGNRLGNKVAFIMGTNYRYGNTMTRSYPNTNDTDYYGVTRASIGGNVRYSFIIEHDFHTNPISCGILNSDNNLRQIAIGEAEVLAEYFGLQKKYIEPVQVQEEDLMGKILDELASKYGEDSIKSALEKLLNDDVPAWKQDGVDYFVLNGYLKNQHNGNEILDVGTAATMFSNREKFLKTKTVSDWAKESINKAVTLGILKGNESGLRPADSVTREELMVFFDRLGFFK